MKILIPNAKELNTRLKGEGCRPLSDESEQVLQSLLRLSDSELAQLYGIKEERASLESDRWKRIALKQAKSYPAWELYDGLMYRYMNRRELSSVERAYLAENAYIATSFYGLISVFEKISPHRLDFQGKVMVQDQSLRQFWRKQYDALVESDELLISLLSSEFESVFSPVIQKRLVKIVFMEERECQLKIHSTISKKGRGRFLSAMAQQSILDLASLKCLDVDGFSFREDLSAERKLIFVRSETAVL